MPGDPEAQEPQEGKEEMQGSRDALNPVPKRTVSENPLSGTNTWLCGGN